jgi:hypothetical protein
MIFHNLHLRLKVIENAKIRLEHLRTMPSFGQRFSVTAMRTCVEGSATTYYNAFSPFRFAATKLLYCRRNVYSLARYFPIVAVHVTATPLQSIFHDLPHNLCPVSGGSYPEIVI